MSYEKLYRAQVEEHEKTTARLRTVEKENATLRGMIGDQQRQYDVAVEMLHDAAQTILRVFPRDTGPSDGVPHG